jgi:O-antigen/teichoic acid export membrane protein
MGLKSKAFLNLKWSFFQQISNQILSFVISIVLARLLLPADFGLMGMIYIILTIGTVLIDSGLSTSLIRSETVDQKELSTVFFANISIAVLFYFIIFFTAPFVAVFYKQEILTNLIRFQGLTLIFSSIWSIQNVLLIKELNFKKITTMSLISGFFGSIIGITLAYFDYGVWSIVIMNNFTIILNTLLHWVYSSWRPNLEFSKEKFLYHYKFGYKLVIVQLFDAIFGNIYNLIIGKVYNKNTLGFYTRADSFKKTIIFSISTPLKSILLPILTSIKDDQEKLKKIYILLLQTVLLVISPVLLFFVVFAKPIFILLFTEKWNMAIPYFQIVCLAGILYPINTYIVSFLNVKGRSDLVLKIDIIKRIGLALGIIISLWFKDIYILVWSQVYMSIFDFFVNVFVLKNILNYPILVQFKNISNVLLISFSSAFLIFLINIYLLEHFFNNFSSIVLGLMIFLVLNFGILYILNRNLYQTILITLRK